MDPKRSHKILLLAFLLFSLCLDGQEEITLGNALFQKSFSKNTKQAGPIHVKLFDQQNRLLNSAAQSFFEFYIDSNIVKSSDEIWRFEAMNARKMGNGGMEYRLNYTIVTGPLIGLKVQIFQQLWEKSPLMREKIILSASEDQSFRLTKLQGENHFHFPTYEILSASTKEATALEIKLASWELRPTTFGPKEKGNHMYYPAISQSKLNSEKSTFKGPVLITSDGDISWFTAYEHASQDNTKGMFDETKKESQFIIDAMQGTKGVFNFPISDEDFMFLGITTSESAQGFTVCLAGKRGAYYENEVVDASHPYESVWSASAFYKGKDLETGKSILRKYILDQICEHPITREIEFYYNTWGLQRNDRSKPLRGILTYERIFEEIEYAAELGVDIFVLDDGWEAAQGDWTPHKVRLDRGLAPIKEKLDSLGIKMGLWLSPMGIDSTTQRYKDHPEWVIKDSENKAILAQWGHPAFDFVSDFYDVFVDDCKKLIDQGCRFMKWDAINTFYSSLANLNHGDEGVSEAERRARYEFLLPIYVTKAMEELMAYEPGLVIEIDITEARRVMTGLAPLSQGKFFWMNNGASGYNDYSTYRSQSMRTIINEYADLIPREVLTYANYPHDQEGALEYNVINSILAGNGFWGNLSLMKKEEVKKVGDLVKNAKALQDELYGIHPRVQGKVGDSPEIYQFYDEESGNGQVITFASEATDSEFNFYVGEEKVLGVLNAPFTIEEDSLVIAVNHEGPYTANIHPIIGHHERGYRFISSSNPIVSLIHREEVVQYEVSETGQQVVLWAKALGKPEISSSKAVDASIIDLEDLPYCRIEIKNLSENQIVSIEKL